MRAGRKESGAEDGPGKGLDHEDAKDRKSAGRSGRFVTGELAGGSEFQKGVDGGGGWCYHQGVMQGGRR